MIAKYLMDMKNPTGRLGRWVMRLSEFDFELSYRKGKFMDIADCLSRNSQRVSTHRDDSEDVTAAKAEWMIMQLETGTTKGALFEVNLTGPGGRPFREEGGRNNIENSHLPDLTYNSDSDDEYDDEQSIMALACGAAQTNSDAQMYAAQVLDEEEEHEGRSQSRLDIPDGLKARFISERSMAAEQGRDPFCQQIVKELERMGCKGSRHYVVRDGLLSKPKCMLDRWTASTAWRTILDLSPRCSERCTLTVAHHRTMGTKMPAPRRSFGLSSPQPAGGEHLRICF